MRYRYCLVSNSSSSSFICQKTCDPEEARDQLNNLISFFNSFFNKELTFERVFEQPFIVGSGERSSDYKDLISEFLFDEHYREVYFIEKIEDLEGKLIINSASSNSIPSLMYEFIEHAFDAHRVHMG